MGAHDQRLRPAQQVLVEVAAYLQKGYVITPFEASLWNSVIDRYGDDAVIRFLRVYVEHATFVPKVSDALRALDPAANGSAASAFVELSSAVARVGPWRDPEFSDPLIVDAVIRLGGWPQVCQDLPASDPESRFAFEAYMKRFTAAYEYAAGMKRAGRELLGGSLHGLHAIGRREHLALAAPAAPGALIAPDPEAAIRPRQELPA